jgi:AcrR family transcriptional regulator
VRRWPSSTTSGSAAPWWSPSTSPRAEDLPDHSTAPPAEAPPRRPATPKQQRSQATRRRLLDAAVDELVERGYARLTTHGVAARAGVSRGAEQHHFRSRAELMAEAIDHLAERQLGELREQAGVLAGGPARTERVLDLLMDQYSGPLFAATIELSLAARGDEELRAAILPRERALSRDIQRRASGLFGSELAARPGFEGRLAVALSTVRGLALLRLFGHPRAAVERQWSFTRAELVRLLRSG